MNYNASCSRQGRGTTTGSNSTVCECHLQSPSDLWRQHLTEHSQTDWRPGRQTACQCRTFAKRKYDVGFNRCHTSLRRNMICREHVSDMDPEDIVDNALSCWYQNQAHGQQCSRMDQPSSHESWSNMDEDGWDKVSTCCCRHHTLTQYSTEKGSHHTTDEWKSWNETQENLDQSQCQNQIHCQHSTDFSYHTKRKTWNCLDQEVEDGSMVFHSRIRPLKQMWAEMDFATVSEESECFNEEDLRMGGSCAQRQESAEVNHQEVNFWGEILDEEVEQDVESGTRTKRSDEGFGFCMIRTQRAASKERTFLLNQYQEDSRNESLDRDDSNSNEDIEESDLLHGNRNTQNVEREFLTPFTVDISEQDQSVLNIEHGVEVTQIKLSSKRYFETVSSAPERPYENDKRDHRNDDWEMWKSKFTCTRENIEITISSDLGYDLGEVTPNSESCSLIPASDQIFAVSQKLGTPPDFTDHDKIGENVLESIDYGEQHVRKRGVDFTHCSTQQTLQQNANPTSSRRKEIGVYTTSPTDSTVRLLNSNIESFANRERGAQFGRKDCEDSSEVSNMEIDKVHMEKIHEKKKLGLKMHRPYENLPNASRQLSFESRYRPKLSTASCQELGEYSTCSTTKPSRVFIDERLAHQQSASTSPQELFQDSTTNSATKHGTSTVDSLDESMTCPQLVTCFARQFQKSTSASTKSSNYLPGDDIECPKLEIILSQQFEDSSSVSGTRESTIALRDEKFESQKVDIILSQQFGDSSSVSGTRESTIAFRDEKFESQKVDISGTQYSEISTSSSRKSLNHSSKFSDKMERRNLGIILARQFQEPPTNAPKESSSSTFEDEKPATYKKDNTRHCKYSTTSYSIQSSQNLSGVTTGSQTLQTNLSQQFEDLTQTATEESSIAFEDDMFNRNKLDNNHQCENCTTRATTKSSNQSSCDTSGSSKLEIIFSGQFEDFTSSGKNPSIGFSDDNCDHPKVGNTRQLEESTTSFTIKSFSSFTDETIENPKLDTILSRQIEVLPESITTKPAIHFSDETMKQPSGTSLSQRFGDSSTNVASKSSLQNGHEAIEHPKIESRPTVTLVDYTTNSLTQSFNETMERSKVESTKRLLDLDLINSTSNISKSFRDEPIELSKVENIEKIEDFTMIGAISPSSHLNDETMARVNEKNIGHFEDFTRNAAIEPSLHYGFEPKERPKEQSRPTERLKHLSTNSTTKTLNYFRDETIELSSVKNTGKLEDFTRNTAKWPSLHYGFEAKEQPKEESAVQLVNSNRNAAILPTLHYGFEAKERPKEVSTERLKYLSTNSKTKTLNDFRDETIELTKVENSGQFEDFTSNAAKLPSLHYGFEAKERPKEVSTERLKYLSTNSKTKTLNDSRDETIELSKVENSGQFEDFTSNAAKLPSLHYGFEAKERPKEERSVQLVNSNRNAAILSSLDYDFQTVEALKVENPGRFGDSIKNSAIVSSSHYGDEIKLPKAESTGKLSPVDPLTNSWTKSSNNFRDEQINDPKETVLSHQFDGTSKNVTKNSPGHLNDNIMTFSKPYQSQKELNAKSAFLTNCHHFPLLSSAPNRPLEENVNPEYNNASEFEFEKVGTEEQKMFHLTGQDNLRQNSVIVPFQNRLGNTILPMNQPLFFPHQEETMRTRNENRIRSLQPMQAANVLGNRPCAEFSKTYPKPLLHETENANVNVLFLNSKCDRQIECCQRRKKCEKENSYENDVIWKDMEIKEWRKRNEFIGMKNAKRLQTNIDEKKLNYKEQFKEREGKRERRTLKIGKKIICIKDRQCIYVKRLSETSCETNELEEGESEFSEKSVSTKKVICQVVGLREDRRKQNHKSIPYRHRVPTTDSRQSSSESSSSRVVSEENIKQHANRGYPSRPFHYSIYFFCLVLIYIIWIISEFKCSYTYLGMKKRHNNFFCNFIK